MNKLQAELDALLERKREYERVQQHYLPIIHQESESVAKYIKEGLDRHHGRMESIRKQITRELGGDGDLANELIPDAKKVMAAFLRGFCNGYDEPNLADDETAEVPRHPAASKEDGQMEGVVGDNDSIDGDDEHRGRETVTDAHELQLNDPVSHPNDKISVSDYNIGGSQDGLGNACIEIIQRRVKIVQGRVEGQVFFEVCTTLPSGPRLTTHSVPVVLGRDIAPWREGAHERKDRQPTAKPHLALSDPLAVQKEIQAADEVLRRKIHKLMIKHTQQLVDIEETARKDGLSQGSLQEIFAGPAGMTARVVYDWSCAYLGTFMDSGKKDNDDSGSSGAETIKHVPGDDSGLSGLDSDEDELPLPKEKRVVEAAEATQETQSEDEVDDEVEPVYVLPNDPNDEDYTIVADGELQDESSELETEDVDIEEDDIEEDDIEEDDIEEDEYVVASAPPMWTDKGTIAWDKVKNKDYIFNTIGSRTPTGPYYYILRCESTPRLNTHHFMRNPWRAGPDHVGLHLKQPLRGGLKCHDSSTGWKLASAKQSEIQKTLGYEVIMPYAIHTPEGREENGRLVKESNAYVMQRARELTASSF
ncbi:hypothetical protein B0T16DRAFT_393222 [Cercophora newfieldiana]|uniref:Uncharacterized protein n=1 Tax=Cercophora newfieldiana TaxID=92897 RepID=A0AA40CKX4_9PEZI|nr:hypothetical protein B0T16DRAFT_393222 [Cercophora newfieldiana]